MNSELKITKFIHACFSVNLEDQSLVVDPGVLTTDFVMPKNVIGVVITHQHADHIDQDLINDIVEQNPELTIYTIDDVETGQPNQTKFVSAGQTVEVGSFKLEFFGGAHRPIHEDWPICKNLGVMINDEIYYPGDSLTLPEKPVKILALPIAAPWLKTAEAMNFLMEIKPEKAFATHDAVLSPAGKKFVDNWINMAAEKVGSKYQTATSLVDSQKIN
ncbi:MBL fold metallo-hydrolase [Candidatus Saccharibacteria bacterium]|nr:MAG: MBL fold metallo-hydrolase [Candidatus Saccharibacteria bacterium]